MSNNGGWGLGDQSSKNWEMEKLSSLEKFGMAVLQAFINRVIHPYLFSGNYGPMAREENRGGNTSVYKIHKMKHKGKAHSPDHW